MQQGRREVKVHKVLKVLHPPLLVRQAHKVAKALKVHKEVLGQLAQRGRKEHKAHRGQLQPLPALLAHRERRVHKAVRVPLRP